MPTYDVFASFWRLAQPDAAAAAHIYAGPGQFIADLRSGTFRAGLRVKRVQTHPGVWEMTWAADGRATFEYGDEVRGEPHIGWRRIGTHDIFRRP